MPNSEKRTPHVIVGADAFPLSNNLMKPYPHRLSRARRVVENAFGILANRFRVFHSAIRLTPDKVVTVVLACLALHNFLLKENKVEYTPKCAVTREDLATGQLMIPTKNQQNEHLAPLRYVRDRNNNEAKRLEKYFAITLMKKDLSPGKIE